MECADGAADVGTALRRERGALALALGIGDLAGALPLEAVVESCPTSPTGRWKRPWMR
jgi:glutamate-ammonia-ligase adenylyltransferase